jgi:hypothetical protein
VTSLISARTDTHADKAGPGERGWLLPAVLFMLVLLQAATVAVTVKAISPFDEAAHFDYVVQLQHSVFPVPAGQKYTQEAIQEWACRPVDRAASVAALCRKPVIANDPRLPFGGINYEAPFGPIYYASAALGSAILSAVGVPEFTGARLVSAMLYALGAALLLQVAQRMALSPLAATGAILAAASTGLALSIGATINPDAMAFLGTAAVLASAVLVRPWRSAVMWTALVGALAGLTKPNFILIAILGTMLLLLRRASIDRPTGGEWTAGRLLRLGAGLGLPVVASAAASAGWALLAAARNQTGAPADGGVHLMLQSSLGPVERAAEQMLALLRPDGGTAPGPAFTVLDTPLLRVAGLIVVLATLGACLSAWLSRMDADPRSVLVLRAVALAIPASAVVLVAIYWITFQGGHWTASRYALPFLAAASVGIGAIARPRATVPIAMFGIAVWLAAWVGIVA